MICISSAKEHAELKNKLPPLFRELPLKLGGEGKVMFQDVFAIIEINFRSGAIMLNSNIWQGPMLGLYKDAVEVKKVCFNTDKNEIIISFNSDAKDIKGKYTDSAVALDIGIKKISKSEEKGIMDKIYQKTNSGGAADKKPMDKVNQ